MNAQEKLEAIAHTVREYSPRGFAAVIARTPGVTERSAKALLKSATHREVLMSMIPGYSVEYIPSRGYSSSKNGAFARNGSCNAKRGTYVPAQVFITPR